MLHQHVLDELYEALLGLRVGTLVQCLDRAGQTHAVEDKVGAYEALDARLDAAAGLDGLVDTLRERRWLRNVSEASLKEG